MTLKQSLFDSQVQGTAASNANTGGTLGGVTGGSPNNTVIYDSGVAAHGTMGLLFTNVSGGNVSGAVLDMPPNATNLNLAVSIVVTFPASMPSTTISLIQQRNTTTRVVQIQLDPTSGLTVLDKGNVSNTIASAATVTSSMLGKKVRISYVLQTNASTGATAGIMLVKAYDNTSGTQIGSTVSVTNANLTTDVFSLTRFGAIGNVIYSFGFDDLQQNDGATSEISAYSPPANIPPTVTVGANQTSTIGTTVTLTSTASDSDGTIASRQWVVLAYPAGSTSPTLTGATSATATFVPSAAGVYTFGFSAVDNLGASSTQATTTVYIPGSTVVPISVTINTGPWTVSGAGVPELSDSNDSTYVESPPSPTGGVTSLRVRLAPLLTPAAFSMTIRALLSASGTNTVSVKLYEGGTLRKTWTPTITTSLAPYTFTLTSGEIATIGSWLALDVQIEYTGS
jgi:hypothetical protein